MRNTIALVFVFNHKFEKNISKLKEIYGKRFSNIFFLMPFYDGAEENVIPVYEASYFFQGFFVQGFEKYFREEFTHYVYIADDLILHPDINEENILDFLNIKDDSTGYFKSIDDLSNAPLRWSHTLQAIRAWHNHGTNLKGEIPEIDEAIKKFSEHGLTYKGRLNIKNVGKINRKILHKGNREHLLFYIRSKLKKSRDIQIEYPMAWGYSDFAVIPRKAIKKFIKINSIFSAINLFVEVAIPTSMILSVDKIIQEKDIELKGAELWEAHEVDEVTAKTNYKIESLNSYIKENKLLYIHPIKLSKWNK